MYYTRTEDEDEIQIDPEDYDSENAQQFVRDCQDEGFDVEHYRGRFYWEGPAVICDSISDVMSITSVRCQCDNMGLGFIVYPEESAELTPEALEKMEKWRKRKN